MEVLHPAIVVAVGTAISEKGAYTTYAVKIYECNADAANTCHTYDSKFQIQTTTKGKVVTVPSMSTVSSYNSSAPLFYR